MTFLSQFKATFQDTFSEHFAEHYGEEPETAEHCIANLAIFFTGIARQHLKSELRGKAFLQFMSEDALTAASFRETPVVFDQGSGTDAFLLNGERILNWLFGESTPAVIQAVKTTCEMRPSSTQQLVKLFASVFFHYLAEQQTSAQVEEESWNSILSEEPAPPYSGEVTSWFAASGTEPREGFRTTTPPTILQRITPWILLAVASLLLLFLLNRGCTSPVQVEDSGDAIIHEM